MKIKNDEIAANLKNEKGVEIYQDILSRAIPYDAMTESQGRVLTDHGWVSDEDFALLVERRLPKYLAKQKKEN